MPKAQLHASIDPQVLARYDAAIDGNRSEDLEEYMRKKANLANSDNEELVKRREQLEEKLEELRDERAEVESSIEQVETELNAIRSSLEKAEEEKDVIEDALPVLIDKFEEFRRKKRDTEEALTALACCKTFDLWLSKIDGMDSDDLKEKVREEVEK